METFHIEIKSLTKKDAFGRPELVAQIFYTVGYGDNTGEVELYEIHDENLDEWVCVDLEKLNKFNLKQIQNRIDKHILENPEMFEREPEEAS